MLRSLFKSTLKAAGFRLVREPVSAEYGGILPVSTYSPWNTDREFNQVYQAIRDNTLVDVYRCWELWTLAGQAAKLSPGATLEVGVWRGGTGALLAKRAGLPGQERPVYLCDTFTGVVKAGPRDTAYKGGEHSDTSKEAVERLLRSMEIKNARIIQGTFPDESQSQISDSRFCLVHIDVDTYQSAKDILEWAWGRLVPGGMVVFDDYGFHFCEGITKLVNGHAGDADKLLLHNLNGHAILVKTAGAAAQL